MLPDTGARPRTEFHLRAPELIIRQYDVDMIYISGPGHAARRSANTIWKAATVRYPHVSQDLKRASGICSDSSRFRADPIRRPNVRSIQSGESILAEPRVQRRLRQPALVVACVVGDGEAETGRRDGMALEQVSRSGSDGAVLPILHLNGYKIANPTILARIPRELCAGAATADAVFRRRSRAPADA
jgi:xylulose-5-phosphate/fructose-6-phosphate phosphoketolase